MASWQSHYLRWLARLGSAYTDFALSRSLATLRRDSLRGASVPAGTVVQPVSVDGVPCEWITSSRAGTPRASPPERVILYLHGGGWILGWGNTHRRLVAQIGAACDARALAVDYRLAPENRFPAALQDCLTAYRWLLRAGTPPSSIAIAGDSAGGNLTIATLLALRQAGDPLPAAGVCLSPAVDLAGRRPDADGGGAEAGPGIRRGSEQLQGGMLAEDSGPLRIGSRVQRPQGSDPMLSRRAGRFMAQSYVGSQDPRNPLISPVYADLGGLPPLLIQVGEDENLREGAERLAGKARQSGVDATLEVWPAMWHVWHIFGPALPEARQAIEHIGAFVRRHVAAEQSAETEGSQGS